MSDNPDRLGPWNGGTGFGPSSCEYPASRSDSAGVADQETASTTPSEDFSDLFDFDAFARDHVTDVTTQSDAASEGRPARVAAGLPVSQDEDSHMPDAPSPELPLPHVWPEVLGPHPARRRNIHLETSPSPPPSPEMHLQEPYQAISPSGPKKTRVVKSPAETSQVREVGACYYCRMSKTKCDPSSICVPCSKRPFPESVCIRKPLPEMVPSKFGRWNWNDPNFLMPGREQFAEHELRHVFISSSESINSPCLKLAVRPFALPNQKDQGSQARWGISPLEGPVEVRKVLEAIHSWGMQQIMVQDGTDFEGAMDKLLLEFVRDPARIRQLEGHQILEPLLSNLLRMRCMWKVWSCKQLFFRPHLESQASPFGLRFASVQDSLRMLAAQSISELERKILPDLDKYLSKYLAKKDTLAIKWFLLWQMMLLYRQSLSLVLEQQQTDAAPISIAVMPKNEERHTFRRITGQLLEAVIVIYSALFKKDTTVERAMNAEPRVFANDCALHTAYQRAWQALPDFYQQVSREVSPTDQLFTTYIVTKESAILANARGSRK